MSSTEAATATATITAPPLPTNTATAVEETSPCNRKISNNSHSTTTTSSSNSSTPPPQSHESSSAVATAPRDYGASRRVTIGCSAEERRNFGPLAMELPHNGTGGDYLLNNRRPSGFGGGGDHSMDFLGGGVGMGSRRDSLDSTTAVLDAAILDLTRRRLSMAIGPESSGGGGGGSSWGGHAHTQHHASSYSASIAAKQQQLQQQQRELEQRQKELELQRQQLIAGMQEHARSTSMLAAHHHHQQQMMHHPPYQYQPYAQPYGHAHAHTYSHTYSHPHAHEQQQQWWVCQVCNSKAFASQEEAMRHEANCCPEPQRLDHHNGMAIPIPSDHMHGRSFSMGLGGGGGGGGPYDVPPGYPQGQQQRYVSPQDPVMDPYSSVPSSSPPTMLLSEGQFAQMKEARPLAMPSDKDWLTPLHCFVRRQCVEIFTASEGDVSTPSKGKRKPIQIGSVGIRCPWCRKSDNDNGGKNNKLRERGSVYYPTSIASIYNATMNLLQRHLHNCNAVPEEVMRRYETLKGDDARSGTSKRYWIESSMSLGLVDTPMGIRYSAHPPPPLPSLSRQQQQQVVATTTGQYSNERRNSNDFFSSNSNAVTELSRDNGSNNNNNSNNNDGDDDGLNTPPPSAASGDDAGETASSMSDSATLVTADDEALATGFSYQLLSQMQQCVFTEADRLGKRKGLPAGFPGLACRHCFGGYGTGRFFPSSIKTLSDTSKTLNVLHNHMMRCRKCPQEIRDTLKKLRETHEDERSKMRFGSQKAFFGKIWQRLHKNGPLPPTPVKRKAVSAGTPGEIACSSGGGPPTVSMYPPPYPGPPLTTTTTTMTMHPFHTTMGAANFGPPITATPGTLSQHNSFSGLDSLGRPIGAPETKRRRSNGDV